MLPIAAPAASILAASLPRWAPCSPFFSFFCFSCFSISVALAGKIAGNARKSPPTAGPNCLAMTRAMAVNESTEKQTEPRNYAILFDPRAFIL